MGLYNSSIVAHTQRQSPAQRGHGLTPRMNPGACARYLVKWTGPNGQGDYVTIVKKGASVGTYTEYFYTRDGNPGTLTMPSEPGEYELRYSTETVSPNPTLFSLPITLKK
jgi:Ca-activated chloride channel homolog